MKTIMTILCALCAIGLLSHTAYAQAPEVPLEQNVFYPQAEAAPEEVSLPIIMYHLITEKPKYIGKYGVTPAEVEQDLAYLKAAGFTTVFMADIINFVHKGEPLPPKPILLTFDDGNASDFTYLLPLLQQYDMKAVLAIIGDATDKYTADSKKNTKAKYPNLTWEQVQALHGSGHIEVQSHGYNVHGKLGSGKKSGEGQEAYHKRLLADLMQLQAACEANLSYLPNTFVYPLGIVGQNSRAVLEELGMEASLGCEEGINTLRQGHVDCLFKMHRYNRPSGKTVESILRKYQ